MLSPRILSAEAPGSKVMETCYLHVSSGHPVGLCNTRLFGVTRAWKNYEKKTGMEIIPVDYTHTQTHTHSLTRAHLSLTYGKHTGDK